MRWPSEAAIAQVTRYTPAGSGVSRRPDRVLPSDETLLRSGMARPWASSSSMLENGAANRSLKVRLTDRTADAVCPSPGVALTRRAWAQTG